MWPLVLVLSALLLEPTLEEKLAEIRVRSETGAKDAKDYEIAEAEANFSKRSKAAAPFPARQ